MRTALKICYNRSLMAVTGTLQSLKARPSTGLRLSPYFGIGSSPPPESGEVDPAVRTLLRDHVLNQALGLIAAIEAKEPRPLPPILAAVDRETDRLASRRVDNMLRAFVWLLEDSETFGAKDDPPLTHLRVFDPILVSGRWLTSPALLVVQAILYSHTKWPTGFHEARSAWAAYSFLGPMPDAGATATPLEPQERAFVAALIAHQTLLRAAWNIRGDAEKRREVAAFKSGTFKLTSNPPKAADNKAVAQGIARTLPVYLEESSAAGPTLERLVAALVLFSLCLEFRHERLTENDQKFTSAASPSRPWLNLKEALKFCDLMSVVNPKSAWRLIHWQYGHHVMEALPPEAVWNDLFSSELAKLKPTGNMTYSFDPTAPRSHWERWYRGGSPASPEWAQFRLESNNDQRVVTDIAAAIEATVGHACTIAPSPTEKLIGSLGIEAGAHVAWRDVVSAWVNKREGIYHAMHVILNKLKADYLGYFDQARGFLENGYFPAPLIGRILREMRRVRPEDFSILWLYPRELPSDIADTPFITGPLTIFLPREPPPAKDHKQRREVELVASYAAAMVINLQVSLAPKRVELDFFSRDARERWGQLIEAALWANGHQGITEYLEQYRAEVCGTPITEALDLGEPSPLLPVSSLTEVEMVLGIDVGAGSVKCGLIPVCAVLAGDDLKELDLQPPSPSSDRFIEFPTAAPEGRYKDAREFATRVVKLIKDRKAEWLSGLRVVGVAWPGAVRGGSYVAAPSKIVANFQGFDWPRREDPRKVHRLNLKEAFEEAFRKAGAAAEIVVTILNDGDADVKGEEKVGRAQWTEGVSVVLKQGSGTACGVYVGGRQVPILAEMGKAVLNLEPERAWQEPEPTTHLPPRPFPAGTLNKYCSKASLSAIADSLRWAAPPRTPPIDAREIGYFLEENPHKKKNLLERIAQEVVFGRFKDLFDGPTAISLNELTLYYPKGFDLLSIGRRRIDQLQKCAGGVNEARELADRCAQLAGFLLADSIALLVDVFRCREVRLAGGPLSGSTGRLVTETAQERLSRLYGYKVDSVRQDQKAAKDRLDPQVHAAQLHAPHVLREVSKIRLVYPRDSQGHTGERGAARAALEAFVLEEKRRALARVRAYVADRESNDPFSVRELIKEVEGAGRRLAVVEREVKGLLEAYMASLSLTFLPPDRYGKLGR